MKPSLIIPGLGIFFFPKNCSRIRIQLLLLLLSLLLLSPSSSIINIISYYLIIICFELLLSLEGKDNMIQFSTSFKSSPRMRLMLDTWEFKLREGRLLSLIPEIHRGARSLPETKKARTRGTSGEFVVQWTCVGFRTDRWVAGQLYGHFECPRCRQRWL